MYKLLLTTYLFFSVGMVVVGLGGWNKEKFAELVIDLDFKALYTAVSMVVGGETVGVYELSNQYTWQQKIVTNDVWEGNLMPYLSSPVLVTFGRLVFTEDIIKSYWLMWAANVLVVLVLSVLLSRITGKSGWSGGLLVVTFVPVWSAITQGQSSLIMLLGLILVWGGERLKKDGYGYLGWSLLFIKPSVVLYPAIFFIITKEWKKLVELIGGGLITVMIGVLVVGVEGFKNWAKLLIGAGGLGESYTIFQKYEPTWLGFLVNMGLDEKMLCGVWIVGVVGFTWWLVKVWGMNRLRGWEMLVWGMIFTSLHTNYHDLSLLLFAEALNMRNNKFKGVQTMVLMRLVMLLVYMQTMVFVPILGLKMAIESRRRRV